MSLADELLADLEEGGEVEDDHLLQLDAPVQEVEEVPMEVDNKFHTIRAIAKLRDSEQLKRVMVEVDERRNSERNDAAGPVEADPEYQLIVEANNLAVEIDNEINIIHKFTRDKYSKRFPELESLVPVPLQYVATVKELGNDLDKAKNSEILQEFLTPATIMVVSVTASTTQGQFLSEEDLKVIVEACDMAIELDNFKQEIYAYVESRMSFIAPNISAIVGASTAAKLMGCIDPARKKSAARMKKMREKRMRENPNFKEEERNRIRELRRKKKGSLGGKDKMAQRIYERNRKRLQRDKKKLGVKRNFVDVATAHYSCSQTYSKALRKSLMPLPKSPSKKTVVKGLAEEIGMQFSNPDKAKGKA